MAKKALLITFEPTTRIVVDVPKEKMGTMELEKYIKDNLESIVETARERMLKNINDYLCWENLVWQEDYECPAEENEEVS